MTSTRNVIGDSGRYTRLTGERRVARATKYGAAAIRRELRNVATVDVKLMHSFQEQPIPPLVMQQLRNYDNYEVQQMGMQEVSRQVKEFTQQSVNLRIATTILTLANGRLGFDAGGNLLPDSSYGSAIETVTFNMNANNQNQLNGIIGTSWNLATTDIPLDLRELKERAAQTTGYEIKYAIYGKNIPTYFEQNDHVLDYLSRSPTMREKYLDTAEIPDGLFGLTWIPGYVSFFEDNDGTNQALLDGDKIIFCPEISNEWWETLEGSYLVPTTINIVTDAAAAIGSMKQTFGMFGYGQVSHNPPTVITYYGDTFLPVIKNPDVVYQADTVI